MPVFFTFSSASLVGSLLSTLLVERFLTERISLVGSLVGFELVQNAGIAFGINLPFFILVLLLPAAVALLGTLAWRERRDRLHSLCFGLILGGALGNIIDRLDDGFVTDFIQIGWWPLFNIADSCITVGVVLLLIMEWRKSEKRNPKNEIKKLKM